MKLHAIQYQPHGRVVVISISQAECREISLLELCEEAGHAEESSMPLFAQAQSCLERRRPPSQRFQRM